MTKSEMWNTVVGVIMGSQLQYKDKRELIDFVRHVEADQEAREDPQPLTIEELRQMDGEPVWVVEWNHWALVSVEEIRKLGEIPFLRCVMYGVEHCYNADVQNIHCYRHKPKEET